MHFIFTHKKKKFVLEQFQMPTSNAIKPVSSRLWAVILIWLQTSSNPYLGKIGQFAFTINENNRFIDAELVGELWVDHSFVDVCPKICALIPANVKVININMAQILHHLELISHCKLKTTLLTEMQWQ